MTRARAIERFQQMKKILSIPNSDAARTIEAIDMAIEALEQEPIIHCKDCKYWHEWENGTGSCHRSDIMWVGTDYDDYCGFAERKE